MDELEKEVMRVAGEPCEYFDEWAVHHGLTERPGEYYRFVLEELKDIASGRAVLELPPKQVFTDPGSQSDFRVMPCVVRGRSGVRKTVKLVGTNIVQEKVPDQITVGKAFAIHPDENFVSHIFEACLLSSARTGVCAAMAIELLSSERGKVAVFGAGRVGYYSALYAASLGGVERVSFFDIDGDRARKTAELLSRTAPGVVFSAAEGGEETGETDVVILATTSVKPVLSPPGLGANLVISMGADTDYQSELDPAWAAVSDIFVDTEDSVRFGDIANWLKAGLISGRPADLREVLRAGVPLPNRPRVFVSTGSALFDNLTIGYLLRNR